MPFANFEASIRSVVPVLVAVLLFPACRAKNLGDETPLCERCHGGNGSAAPPRTVHGATDATARGVGAHRPHLDGGPLRGPIECRECHDVPGPTPEDNPNGHIGDGVKVTFGGPYGRVHVPPGTDCTSPSASCPTWDTPAPGRCANVYCHGATLNAGGTNTAPDWTGGPSEAACGTCHGTPPPAPQHPAAASCEPCHAGYTPSTVNLATHIDGTLDVVLSCTSCHGDPLRVSNAAAPPVGTNGETATTTRAVGAHQNHLTNGTIRHAIACQECHALPSSLTHSDGAVQLAWGTLATARGAQPTWNAGTERCGNAYCHGGRGAGVPDPGGNAETPRWTQVDGTQKQCGSCHGNPPMPSHTGRGSNCNGCHGLTVNADNVTIDVAGGHHIDGIVDGGGGPCGSCHAVPPATGAHLAHASFVQPTDASYGSLATYEDLGPAARGATYAFGCGHCHPVNGAMHMNGTTDVVVTPPGPPASDHDLKQRNAANATYDPTPVTGGCSGVYCHSSGQASPTYRTSPAWTSAAGTLGCNGCHDDPPQYDSGGPGAASANSHVSLDVDAEACNGASPPCSPANRAWEFGHFAGLPGPNHSSKHGGGDPNTWGPGMKASPITCQACHFETVDPSNVRTGNGFFYYDTSGDYDLRPLGLSTRGASSSWRSAQCGTCHGPGGTLGDSAGAGSILPLRHVNGRRDVAFDRRTALPAGYAIGVDLATPELVRPYYYVGNGLTTNFAVLGPADCVATPLPSCGVKADVALRTTTTGGTLVTMTLEHAQYDAATKTCSSVACHLTRQYQVDTVGEDPVMPTLQWGDSYEHGGTGGVLTCSSCHSGY